jgi:hypothetical protein
MAAGTSLDFGVRRVRPDERRGRSVQARQMFTAGRIDTMLGWLEWFDGRDQIERYPHLAVLGALAESVEGHPKQAERWAQCATSVDAAGALPGGCRGGVDLRARGVHVSARRRPDAGRCRAGPH